MDHKVLVNSVLNFRYPRSVSEITRMRMLLKGRSGVYALINKLTGEFYVGSSVDLHDRLLDYNQPRYQREKRSTTVVKKIKEYGIENFVVVILEFTDRDSVRKVEQKYMDLYIPEYNDLPFAGDSTGYIHTDLSKLKISNAKIGVRRSDDVRKAMSERQMGAGNTFFGKNHSDERKALLRARALRRTDPHVKAEIVTVTDVKNNITTTYKSMRKAREGMKCSRTVLTKYNNSGKLYKNQYLIHIMKKS